MEDERKPLDRIEVTSFADIPEELKPEGKCFAQLQNGKRCNRETDTPFNIWCFRHQTCGSLGKYAEQAYRHETDIIDPFARAVKRLGEELYAEVPNACDVCGENYVGKPSCKNNHMICVDCIKKLGKSQRPQCPVCRAMLRIRPALFDVVMGNCAEAIANEELKMYFIEFLLKHVQEVVDIQNRRIQEQGDDGMLTPYWLNESDVREIRVGRDANGRPVREEGPIKTYGGDRFYREYYDEFKNSEFFKENINMADLRYRSELKAQANLEDVQALEA